MLCLFDSPYKNTTIMPITEATKRSNKTYKLNNPERVRESNRICQKRWYEKNKDEHRRKMREYYYKRNKCTPANMHNNSVKLYWTKQQKSSTEINGVPPRAADIRHRAIFLSAMATKRINLSVLPSLLSKITLLPTCRQ